MSDTEGGKIVFKKISRKNLRKKVSYDEDDNDETISSIKNKLEETKMKQKLRERASGVNAICLALGEKVSEEILKVTDDPFSLKSEGVVSIAALKNANLKTDDAIEGGIGTQFNAETNKRDEDEEMLKYIEEELAKRKYKKTQQEEEDGNSNTGEKYLSPEEAALRAVPDHLKQSSSHRNEEMLSNQMLSGIPEVDLGIEAKIKNIEATEEAKLRLLWDRHRKKDGPSQFVPTNMAVNFVQHNRFSVDESDKHKNKHGLNQKVDKTSKPADKRKTAEEKATDDYHYERFKKQFRRY